jgi:hypothetical protein
MLNPKKVLFANASIHPYALPVCLTFIAIGFAVAAYHTWAISCTKAIPELLFQLRIVTARFFFTGDNCEC